MQHSPIVPGGGDSTVATLSAGSVLIAAGVVFVIGLVVLIVRYFRLRIPGSNRGDARRSFGYLVRFSNGLLFRGIGDKERRSRTVELKTNLAEAAASEGMAEAIARLGSPRALAASVVEGRLRPRWVSGILAGVVLGFVGFFLHVILIDTWVTAAELSGADNLNGSVGLLPGVRFAYEREGDYRITSIWLLIVPVLAFITWARPWRLFMKNDIEPTSGV